jgi:hypothetical protein
VAQQVAEGIDIFVASDLGSRDHGTGAVVSMAVWSEGADTLLPEYA